MIEHFGLRPDDVLYSPVPAVPPRRQRADRDAGARARDDGGHRRRASPRRGSGTRCARFGATVFDFMGATLTMLHKRPPAPDDTDQSGPAGAGVCPVPEFAAGVRGALRRSAWSRPTARPMPACRSTTRLDEPRRPGSCGRAIPAVRRRASSTTTDARGGGRRGRRARRAAQRAIAASPTATTGMPEATLASRRNLWFHTGDLVAPRRRRLLLLRRPATDSIRRRGENISAFEVEEVVEAAPARPRRRRVRRAERAHRGRRHGGRRRPSRRGPRAGRPGRVLRRAHGPAHAAPLRRPRGRAAPHADREGREGCAAVAGDHGDAWDREAATSSV